MLVGSYAFCGLPPAPCCPVAHFRSTDYSIQHVGRLLRAQTLNPLPDNELDRTARILVRIHGDRISTLDGEPLPLQKADSIATLLVSEHAIQKEARKKLLGSADKPLLPAGTTICFGIKRDTVPSGLARAIVEPKNVVPPTTYRTFVKVVLLSPLFLRLRGDMQGHLQGGACSILALKKEATSLNHAFTLISEVFEPSRKAHTGNVFRRGYYEEAGRWQPLEFLRFRIQGRP
jgi:hypothetical protein